MAKARAIRTRTVYVKSKRRHKAAFTIPTAIVAGFAPLAYHAYYGYRSGRGIEGVLHYAAADFGIDTDDNGKFHLEWLMRGISPIIVGMLVHKVANGLGINRMLSRAGVPFIRV